MRLTGKMSMVLAALVLAIFLVFYAVFRFVFLEGFAELDRREARSDMSRCLHALERERTLIGKFTRDWAAWDDMYKFVQDSNLLWELFRDQEINLLHIYGNRGELVWGKAYDLKTGEELPLNLSEEIGKRAYALLVRQHGPDASARGFVRTPYGPMLAASHPILTSEIRVRAEACLSPGGS
jgi:sensor domain CHASE-containing protein